MAHELMDAIEGINDLSLDLLPNLTIQGRFLRQKMSQMFTM